MLCGITCKWYNFSKWEMPWVIAMGFKYGVLIFLWDLIHFRKYNKSIETRRRFQYLTFTRCLSMVVCACGGGGRKTVNSKNGFKTRSLKETPKWLPIVIVRASPPSPENTRTDGAQPWKRYPPHTVNYLPLLDMCMVWLGNMNFPKH